MLICGDKKNCSTPSQNLLELFDSDKRTLCVMHTINVCMELVSSQLSVSSFFLRNDNNEYM